MSRLRVNASGTGLPGAWLNFEEAEVVHLGPGETSVGRAEGCDLILDDPLVSRRHARFSIDAQGVTLTDLGSANGVFVNGVRVATSRRLVDGDRVTLGRREVRLSLTPPPNYVSGRRRAEQIETVRDEARASPAASAASASPAQRGTAELAGPTHKANLFEMLSGVAEKALSLGRGAEAEHILGRPLLNLLESGRKRGARRADADTASALAINLARVTGKAEWIDYVFRLGTLLVCPPPAPVIDELYAIIRSTPAIDVGLCRSYLDLIRDAQPTFEPNDRFLARRLEGLRAMVAVL